MLREYSIMNVLQVSALTLQWSWRKGNYRITRTRTHATHACMHATHVRTHTHARTHTQKTATTGTICLGALPTKAYGHINKYQLSNITVMTV